MSEGDDALMALWREFADTRSLSLRNQLIEAHLVLARTQAAMLFRHRGSLGVEFADYLQFATMGLIEAIDRFDPARGVQFASFATQRIRGAVLNSLAAMSEEYQQLDLRKRMRQERAESLRPAAPSTGGQPDPFARLADMAIGLALSHLLEGSSMLQPDEGPGSAYHQHFYDAARERELRESLSRLVMSLPEQERRVIRYHYFQNVDFTDIAELLGLSKGRISQIHRRALEMLRHAHARGGHLQRDL